MSNNVKFLKLIPEETDRWTVRWTDRGTDILIKIKNYFQLFLMKVKNSKFLKLMG